MNDSREGLADQLADALPELPDGEYAIVEIMGHRTLVGLIEEVQRFGANMMSVTPILRGQLLDPVFLNGGSIYMLTPCSKEQALKYAPKNDYQLPDPVRCALPPTMLPPPDEAAEFEPVFDGDRQ